MPAAPPIKAIVPVGIGATGAIPVLRPPVVPDPDTDLEDGVASGARVETDSPNAPSTATV